MNICDLSFFLAFNLLMCRIVQFDVLTKTKGKCAKNFLTFFDFNVAAVPNGKQIGLTFRGLKSIESFNLISAISFCSFVRV